MKKAILLSIGTSYEVHLLIDGIFLEKWMLNEVQLGLQASNVCAAHIELVWMTSGSTC